MNAVIWDAKGLWEKARLSLGHAQEQDIDSTDRALWYVFGLELLARAALARVHPVLLADPQDGKNILYAFGVPTERPRSVQSKTVFSRCQSLVDGFTTEDAGLCTALAERRNEELHSAGLAFEGYPLRAWQADLYRVLKTLCAHLGYTLVDLLGREEAAAAEIMLQERAAEVLHVVREAIAAARRRFDSSSTEAQMELRERASSEVTGSLGRSDTERATCPACGSPCLLSGQRVRDFRESFDEDTNKILVRTVVVPTRMECVACGLSFNGHARLQAADLGGEFTVETLYDPIEFFGIELSPGEDFEPDYGND